MNVEIGTVAVAVPFLVIFPIFGIGSLQFEKTSTASQHGMPIRSPDNKITTLAVLAVQVYKEFFRAEPESVSELSLSTCCIHQGPTWHVICRTSKKVELVALQGVPRRWDWENDAFIHCGPNDLPIRLPGIITTGRVGWCTWGPLSWRRENDAFIRWKPTFHYDRPRRLLYVRAMFEP
jgi:hypothetical protein